MDTKVFVEVENSNSLKSKSKEIRGLKHGPMVCTRTIMLFQLFPIDSDYIQLFFPIGVP